MYPANFFKPFILHKTIILTNTDNVYNEDV